MAWRPSPESPRQLIETRQPRDVRAQMEDGRQPVLHDPVIVGDSIRGELIGSRSLCSSLTPSGGRFVCALPLNEVVAIEEKHFDGRTTLVWVGVPLAYFLWLIASSATEA